MRFRRVLSSAVGLCVVAAAETGFAWTSGELKVDVTKSPMNIKVSTTGGKVLAEIVGLNFGTVSYTAITDVAETPAAMTLTLSTHTKLEVSGVEGGLRFKSTNPEVPNVKLTLKDQGEHFFGITQHNVDGSVTPNPNPDLRGKVEIKDKVTAYQRKDEDAEVYSGFYYTTLGYAGFFDHFADGLYNFGTSTGTSISYYAPLIDWYLFYGPSLSKIHKSYFKVIGAPKKVPIWACGPLVWHDNYTGGQMMVDYAKKFAEIKIPYSTMWLDRPYNNGAEGWANMGFEGNFKDPQIWIKQLTDEYYVNLVTWIMPGVFSGTPPAGAFTSSPNKYLDLTDPAQVTWYKDKIKTGQYPYGVKGHKLDRIDNGWTKNVDLPPFKDGTPVHERHKKYAYLNCKVSDEMLKEGANAGDDYFLFPRCAVHRCQQYTSAIWNGDTYVSWGGMITSMGNAIRAGFLGFPMWGSDICGYQKGGMPDSNNYCRWLSFGVYSGFMELMLDGKEPWTIKPEQIQTQVYIRNLFNLRFSLLPYIYSIINTSAENGVTMMPLVGEYPDDPKTIPIIDEYLFGPYMLVAPISTALKTRNLYLPAGKWINVYNYGDEQTGPKDITTPVIALDQIPVYIKSNAIYPTGKVFAGLIKKWEPDFDSKRTVDINAFPGGAGESAVFTYIDYVDANKAKLMKVSVSAANVIAVTSSALTVPGNVVVRLLTAPTSVYLGSVALSAGQYTYDAATKKLSVPFVANQPISVSVNGQVKTLDLYEPVQAHGRATVRHIDGGAELTIPRMSGLSQSSTAAVSVFTMSGRCVCAREIPLNQYAPTRAFVALGKGAFIARISVNGIVAEKAKIIVP